MQAPSSVSLPNIAELDRVAHPSGRNSDGLVDRLLESAPGTVAIVAPASLLPSRLSFSPSHGSCLELRPTPDGPIPIIIDQSILSRGPLSPAEEASGFIPAPISRVASQIASTLQGDGPVCHGTPTYLLVHENVVKPFVRAMDPRIDARVWELGMNKSKAKSFTQSHQGGSHSFLAIFSVRSIDMAIDFLLNDAPTSPITYVFASPRFASYAYSSLKHIPVVHLNRMPQEALVLGAYAERHQFSFSSEAKATYVPRPGNDRYELKASTDRIKRLRARELKQPLGHRIDFFGGSEYAIVSLCRSDHYQASCSLEASRPVPSSPERAMGSLKWPGGCGCGAGHEDLIFIVGEGSAAFRIVANVYMIGSMQGDTYCNLNPALTSMHCPCLINT